MKVSHSILTFMIIIILCSSCELTPPNVNSQGSGPKTLLRNLKVSCTEQEACLKDDESSYEVLARYTEEECKDIDQNSLSFAESSGVIKCKKEKGCSGIVKDFVTDDGNDYFIKSGVYTVYTFIDLNQNETVDLDEPFFCSDDVQVKPAKRLTSIEILMNRQFGE